MSENASVLNIKLQAKGIYYDEVQGNREKFIYYNFMNEKWKHDVELFIINEP